MSYIQVTVHYSKVAVTNFRYLSIIKTQSLNPNMNLNYIKGKSECETPLIVRSFENNLREYRTKSKNLS